MIKILKCTILESNSGPLDLEADALPIGLSMPLTFFSHAELERCRVGPRLAQSTRARGPCPVA